MVCPTPAITLEEVQPARKKRAVKQQKKAQLGLSHTNSVMDASMASSRKPEHSRRASNTSRDRRRVARFAGEDKVIVNVENPDITFEVSFRLDGVSTTVAGYSQMDVYFDPEFRDFEEEDRIRIFRPFWAFNDRILDIQVGTYHV